MADAQRHHPGAISSFSATNRDRERERRTLADLALDPDPPAVEFDELAAQGQPQPRALRLLLGRPHLAKLLEHRLLVFRRDADPGVADRYLDRHPSTGTARTSIRPPSGVNLIAFDSRFSTTCRIFRSSARISPSRLSMLGSRAMDRRPARSRTRVTALSSAVGRWKCVSSSSFGTEGFDLLMEALQAPSGGWYHEATGLGLTRA